MSNLIEQYTNLTIGLYLLPDSELTAASYLLSVLRYEYEKEVVRSSSDS